MTRFLMATAFAVFTLPMAAQAGTIENACLRSDRASATRALCGCIQQVADMTLKSGDQRLAAKFFRDPDRAQQVRMSKSDSDNAFWARYKNFGEMAGAYCGG